MRRRWDGGLGSVLLTGLVGFATACNPAGPTQREVTVTGTVYFDLLPDSGWLVLLNRPVTSAGCTNFDGCGGGYAWVGDAVSGADGRFTITGQVEEDLCGHLWLQLGARDDKPHWLPPEGRPGNQIPCGAGVGYDFSIESGWP